MYLLLVLPDELLKANDELSRIMGRYKLEIESAVEAGKASKTESSTAASSTTPTATAAAAAATAATTAATAASSTPPPSECLLDLSSPQHTAAVKVETNVTSCLQDLGNWHLGVNY